MGLRRLACFLVVLVLGCATLPPAQQTLAELQLRERIETLPAEWIVQGDSHARFVVPLVKWAEGHHITVEMADLRLLRLAGTTLHSDDGTVITLGTHLPANMQLATLVHELAHTMHCSCLNREAAEVFAELVSVRVCAAVGLDVSTESASYLKQNVPFDQQWIVAQKFGKEIEQISSALSKAAKGEK